MGIINEHDYDFDKNGAGKVVGVTVRALREALAELPDENLVVLAKDPEGNGFSPLAIISFDPKGDGIIYRAETTSSGEIEYEEDREEARKEGYDDDDLDRDEYARCVVLAPIS